jgi:hypothetical protein
MTEKHALCLIVASRQRFGTYCREGEGRLSAGLRNGTDDGCRVRADGIVLRTVTNNGYDPIKCRMAQLSSADCLHRIVREPIPGDFALGTSLCDERIRPGTAEPLEAIRLAALSLLAGDNRGFAFIFGRLGIFPLQHHHRDGCRAGTRLGEEGSHDHDARGRVGILKHSVHLPQWSSCAAGRGHVKNCRRRILFFRILGTPPPLEAGAMTVSISTLSVAASQTMPNVPGEEGRENPAWNPIAYAQKKTSRGGSRLVFA